MFNAINNFFCTIFLKTKVEKLKDKIKKLYWRNVTLDFSLKNSVTKIKKQNRI